MSKKVLFVATVVKKHINVFHLPYLQWFQEVGYETHVCARDDFDGEECIIPYCDVHYDIPFERSPISRNNIKAYKELKKIIGENEYEIIHCHTPVAAMLTRLAAIKARKRGTKVIYTAHGFHFFKGAPLINWLVYYPVEWVCSWFTDVLITMNQEDYQLAKKRMRAKDIEYVPGVGVDTNKFSLIKENKVKKREEVGITEDNIVVLSVGELNKNKNHQAIINALAVLSDTNVHYCIAGVGPLESELEQLAKENNLSDRVHLLGFRKDVGELCNIADVFCFPSYREGLSLALMEAMASGLPVICSNIRGNRDLIQDKKGGYLCNPNEIQEIATLLNKIIGDRTKRIEMRKYNKEYIKKFSIDNVKKDIESIYDIK